MDNGGNGEMNLGGVNFDTPPAPIEEQAPTVDNQDILDGQNLTPTTEEQDISQETSPGDLEKTMPVGPEMPLAPEVTQDADQTIPNQQDINPTQPRQVQADQEKRIDKDFEHKLDAVIAADADDPRELLSKTQRLRRSYIKSAFGRTLGGEQ